MDQDMDFRVRLGRVRDRGSRPRSFVGQVLQAAGKAGHGGRAGRAGQRGGRGRALALAVALRAPGRRVVVKARVVRHAGRSFRAAPLATHLAYLKRDGLDRGGAAPSLFDQSGETDGRAFAERCEGDRHHFRFIVSPEDAAELQDLRPFARDLMRRMEQDLGTPLEWVAVDHWDTGHPHLHILLRGRDAEGADLVISGDYMARGIRGRAEALASLELGPRTSREIAAGLDRDMHAERWTRLDSLVDAHAPGHRLDLRPGPRSPDVQMRVLITGRAKVLERLGLAVGEGPGLWRLAPDRRERLRELGRRGDVIATLHRVAGVDRALSDLRPFGEAAAQAIVGKVLARGLQDELSGAAYLVIDGLDGRVHHVACRDLAGTGDTPRGGIVEVVPEKGVAKVRHRSDLSLSAQVTADGATWLDRQLAARDPAARAGRGFGSEVERALDARAEHLAAHGLARRLSDGRAAPVRDLLATLKQRELSREGRRIAAETGLAFEPEGDAVVRGVYRRRVDLVSGRFAMIEGEGGFRLLPWSRRLDRDLGQTIDATLEGGVLRVGPARSPGLGR